MVRGQSNVTVPQEPVKVVVGEDAILGCHLVPPLNATTLGVRWIQEVVWKRSEAIVHVYRANGDSLDNQDENFRGRTSLFRDEMARGNISLKLTNVTKRDEGTYTCHVPSSNIQVKRGNVTLIVAERREDTNQENQTNNSVFPTKPEPELEPEGLGLCAKIGIGCGVGAVLLLLIGGFAIYRWYKRRRTNAAPNMVYGLSNVTVPQESVKVVVGEDAILGCHLVPPLNATSLGVRWIQEVVWKRNGFTVHVYRANGDFLDNQDENFRGRTSLFRDEMARGNISLKLTNVTKRDAGTYTCHVPSSNIQVKRGNVTLIVAERREETNQGNQTNNSGLSAKIGIGCSIGAVLLLLICVIVAVYKWYKRRQTNAAPNMVYGQSNVTVPQEPVKVVVGEDAILGCHLVPPLNATTLGVRWIQEVLWKRNGAIVHIYRAMADHPPDQDENFRGRTSLFRDEMARGNISLKLTNVTKRDAGTYTCHVPSLKSKIWKGNVTLIVEPREETNQGNRTNNSDTEPNGSYGLSNVTVPQEPVKVVVGEDAILGCHLVPPLNATSLGVRWIQEVVWKRNGFTVHVYRANGDSLDNQDKNFTNRTSLFRDEMSRGNISLKLTNVTKRDAGTYTCHVPSSNIQVKRGNVTLIVAERREETNQGNRTSNSVFPTEPEPEPKGLGLSAKIGCGIGAVLLLIGGFAIYKYYKRRQTKTTDTEQNRDYGRVPMEDRNGENQRF
ncbi:hypothetical protein ABVT39_026237 [Epinephelus coioides]